MKCERCGRELTSKLSIERGMGLRCARITELEKRSKLPAKVEETLAFLKMEIKMLKRQINALKLNGVKSTEAIERIKQEVKAVPTEEGNLKGLIHKELVSIFSDPDWRHKLLHSVDEQDTIREPPKTEV